MKNEKTIQSEILLSAGARKLVTLFRQNVGTGWAGDSIQRGPGTVRLGPSDVVVRNARPLKAGLCKGSSDLIGWRSVEITADMVGQRLAVFVAIEVKSPKGRPTKPQLNFIEQVQAAGGIGTIARSATDANTALDVKR